MKMRDSSSSEPHLKRFRSSKELISDGKEQSKSKINKARKQKPWHQRVEASNSKSEEDNNEDNQLVPECNNKFRQQAENYIGMMNNQVNLILEQLNKIEELVHRQE